MLPLQPGRDRGSLRWRAAEVLYLLPLLLAEGVLRYPDGSFESRAPLHLDECGLSPLDSSEGTRSCLHLLREHLLEDGDCNRVICDNIHTSTPIEVYANESDWVPFKNICGHLKELFLNVFELGLNVLGRSATEKVAQLSAMREVFQLRSRWLFQLPQAADAPAYANTTRSVLEWHAAAAVREAETAGPPFTADALFATAVAVARRLQLLIEHVSVTLLLNYHVVQLEYGGRVHERRNLLHELYGDVSQVKVVFHEIPGKRWDALSFLLDKLHEASGTSHVAMAEIGVEAANTSERLLDRNPWLSYVGVDPYVGNDGLFEDVTRRLQPYQLADRLQLHRKTSVAAAELVEDGSLDLVFLDARHDFEAVQADVAAWRGKVRQGGILSGHDFSWMFPTVAMAVYQVVFQVPGSTINLAPDGVWWLEL